MACYAVAEAGSVARTGFCFAPQDDICAFPSLPQPWRARRTLATTHHCLTASRENTCPFCHPYLLPFLRHHLSSRSNDDTATHAPRRNVTTLNVAARGSAAAAAPGLVPLTPTHLLRIWLPHPTQPHHLLQPPSYYLPGPPPPSRLTRIRFPICAARTRAPAVAVFTHGCRVPRYRPPCPHTPLQACHRTCPHLPYAPPASTGTLLRACCMLRHHLRLWTRGGSTRRAGLPRRTGLLAYRAFR